MYNIFEKKDINLGYTTKQQLQALDICMKKQNIAEERRRNYLIEQQNIISEKNSKKNQLYARKISSELRSIKWKL